jgi:2'-5' RNA ligase
VALEPTEAVRRRIGTAAAELRRTAGRAADGIRWVAPENVHLTLQFLGAVPEPRVADVSAALAGAAEAVRGPIALEVRGAGGFPNARRPRVIWLGIEGDLAALGALVEDLGRRLAPLGFPPEARAFSPHLTLGRARDARGGPGLGGAIASVAGGEAIRWRVAEVALVESHLSPRGARYVSIACTALGGRSRT